MGKTRAEYQREYRERRKQRDSTFLQRERLRVKKYKVPIDALNQKKQAEMREKNRMYKRNSRDKQKQLRKQEHCDEQRDSDQPSFERENVEIKVTSTPRSTLKVKLNFTPRKRSAKRSKALRVANSELKMLREKVNSLTRANAKLKKRNQRMLKASQQRCNEEQNPSAGELKASTPKSKAELEIREMGLTPRKVPKKIRKKLIMANAVFDEVKKSKNTNARQTKRRVIANIISGKIIKKYKCIETLSREVCMSRKVINKASSKLASAVQRRRKVLERQKVKRRVTDFFERDDVSVNMPGKNDCKKSRKDQNTEKDQMTKKDENSETEKGQIAEKKQIRVLSDYLANLYEKFVSENPDMKISKSVFCRLRPNHILLTKLISRNTCLCSKHQNIAMKLKALRSLGIEVSPNPETVSKTVSKDEMKNLLTNGLKQQQNVEFKEWKRVEIDGKKKMKIVKVTMTTAESEVYLQQQYEEFLLHVERVKSQCSAIRELKQNLPENECVVQMDFAENWTCSNADEVQSAYWNSTAVTLHPVVVYYKSGSELAHKNIIFVSDVTSHNSTAVYAILQKLVPDMRALFPDLKMIHYWTDSPSSQYRNRYIFDAVLHHEELFHVKARWNYFEAGHGKGPCDGLGGTAKRQAAEACKQGKVNIQDAREFYEWACDQKKSIEYKFYSTEDYENASKALEARNQSPVTGTMKLHAVFPKDGVLHVADISCYCKQCLDGDPCDHWKRQKDTQRKDKLQNRGQMSGNKRPSDAKGEAGGSKKKQKRSSIACQTQASVQKQECETQNSRCDSAVLTEETYALIEYDGDVYPAKVLEIDHEEKEALVSFMEVTKGKGAKKLYKWPSKEDELWVQFEQVLHKIEEPIPCGKSKRQFQLHDAEYKYVDG